MYCDVYAVRFPMSETGNGKEIRKWAMQTSKESKCSQTHIMLAKTCTDRHAVDSFIPPGLLRNNCFGTKPNAIA